MRHWKLCLGAFLCNAAIYAAYEEPFSPLPFIAAEKISPTPTPTPPPAETAEQMPQAWLVGPLLTPSAHVVPKGHFNYEPYLYGSTTYGGYNSRWHGVKLPQNVYQIYTQQNFQIGMPYLMDFTFTPQFAWNYTEGAGHWVLNDMPFGFDFQLHYRQPKEWFPSVKLAIRANFPLGKYQRLNPKKLGQDIGGSGSWTPSIAINMSRMLWFGGVQFLSLRWSVGYAFPTPVHVKGFNAYGGGHHTRGTVFPGQNLQVLFGMEYTWTRHWAFALDLDYSHNNKTRFKGHKGKTAGVPNVIGRPSSEQFSLAPAFEYNWSANVGMIAGVWFTVAGRNSGEFAQGVVAVNIYH